MQKSFYDFSMSDETLNSLTEMGFEEPTPIQQKAIPLGLEGRDIIGQAQTGTGKTVAFGVPLIERCSKGRKPEALVLAPTRELAMQIAEELNRVGKQKRVFALPIYGGQSIERQIRSLKKGAHIVVGTPGRIIDHIKRKTLNLQNIHTVVLDEADEMLNMGFIDDIEFILKQTPSERQTMLFSATIPREIRNIAKQYMKEPVRVSVDTDRMVVSQIRQIFYEVRHTDKITALTRIIDVEDPELTLVFCHTKKEVDEVSSRLKQMGYYAGAIHGDYTQAHRNRIIKQFKSGEIDILVATDVAARGLDITGVSHVINYSIPQNPDSYIHRIGRTGRAGKSGIAITFVTPREYRNLKTIERSAKTRILRAKLPTREDVKRVRLQELKEEILEAFEANEHHDFLAFVDDLAKELSTRDIAAAALSLLYSSDDEDDEIDSEQESTRLFITLGRKDNITVSELIRLLREHTGISGSSIGQISMLDTFSFVEVSASDAPNVVKALNGKALRGRRIKVEQARPHSISRN